MDELMKVIYSEGEPEISGRELHSFLGIKTEYKDWSKRIIDYGFIENADYRSILSDRSDGKAGKPKTDHMISVNMAKEICMLARSERGKQARQYFIEVERRYRTDLNRQQLLKNPNCGENAAEQLLKAVEKAQAELLRLNAPPKEKAVAAVETKLRAGTHAKLKHEAQKRGVTISKMVRLILEKELDWLE